MDTENYLTISDAAERRGVSIAAVYKAIREERISKEKILGRVVVKKDEIDAYPFGSYTPKETGEKIVRAHKERGPGRKRQPRIGTKVPTSSGETADA
jgi:excisionase family DNA binding protein